MQNLYCRNLLNVKFPKIVAEKFAFYREQAAIIVEVYFDEPITSCISSPCEGALGIFIILEVINTKKNN